MGRRHRNQRKRTRKQAPERAVKRMLTTSERIAIDKENYFLYWVDGKVNAVVDRNKNVFHLMAFDSETKLIAGVEYNRAACGLFFGSASNLAQFTASTCENCLDERRKGLGTRALLLPRNVRYYGETRAETRGASYHKPIRHRGPGEWMLTRPTTIHPVAYAPPLSDLDEGKESEHENS